MAQPILHDFNLQNMEKNLITAALQTTHNNVVAAAAKLGITPQALRRRATRLGLEDLLPPSTP